MYILKKKFWSIQCWIICIYLIYIIIIRNETPLHNSQSYCMCHLSHIQTMSHNLIDSSFLNLTMTDAFLKSDFYWRKRTGGVCCTNQSVVHMGQCRLISDCNCCPCVKSTNISKSTKTPIYLIGKGQIHILFVGHPIWCVQ